MADDAIVNLLERLDRWRRARPHADAVVDYDVHASRARGEPVRRGAASAGALWDDVIAMAAALRANGIRAGDIVAVQLPNWQEFFVAHLALYAIGAVTSPISPIYRARDIAPQFATSGAVAFIVPAAFGGFDYAAMALDLARSNARLRTTIVVGGPVPAGALGWGELLAAGRAPQHAAERARIARREYACDVDRMMLLNFTSGTTGRPKGVMHSTRTVSSCAAPTMVRLQLSGDDVILVAPTLGHGGGFLNGFYAPLHLGAKVVYLDAWDAAVAAAVIEREQVSYGPVMPTYLFDLVAHLERTPQADLRSWKTGRVSGGAISRELMSRLQARLPQLRLCPGWGMSENLWSTCGGPDDPLDKRNETDGRLVGDCVIEIRDRSLERSLPFGEVGEIVTRGSSLCLGYFGDDALTRASFTVDGWFKTGDLGRIDAAGYLTMVGRSKDLVIRGGENVPVVEIERLLMEHPAVAAAAVVGVPDARLGEKVCAVIEHKTGAPALDFTRMSEYLAGKQLTRQFIPEYLVVLDRLPKTAVGKIRKQDARTQALARLGSAGRRQ